MQQVALRHGLDGSCHFGCWPEEVVDQGVNRLLHLTPCAVSDPERHALVSDAFLADHFADAMKLIRHALIAGDDVVEGVGNLAR